MRKLTTALFASRLCLLFLFSWGIKEKNDPPPENDPSGEDIKPPVTVDEDPPPKGSTPVSGDGSVMKIDLSYLNKKGMTVDSVFAASADTILVFASSISDGIVSERASLFTYSVSRDAFTGSSMPIGIIGQYPTTVFNDGTVMVMTLNTENYSAEKLLFIDPLTLDYDEYDISVPGGDVRSVMVSPDRQLAAVSNSTELYITDIHFETVYSVMEGYTPEGGDPELDFCLPTAYGWLPDGSGVVGGLLGWEWVNNPIILRPDGSSSSLTDYEYLSATPYGDGLLIYDYFSLVPHGVSSADGKTYAPLELGDLPDQDDDGYISALCACQDGEVLALGISDYSSSPGESRAEIFKNGVSVLSFDLEAEGAYHPDFEAISICPSGKLAVMLSAATVDSQKAIYFCKIQ